MMTNHVLLPTRWRASGPYRPMNASKAGLVEETRLFLIALRRCGNVAQAAAELVDGGLPQRSRDTRDTIVRVIKTRLVNWHPPVWVLDELAEFAADPDSDILRAALLLHAPRQDTLLYDVAQNLVIPLWLGHSSKVTRSDVQSYLDAAQLQHPEIDGWSRVTRTKLAGNLLSILRDFGLLRGTAYKQITPPRVPDIVVAHLMRLLKAEGLSASEIVYHPDWRLWLWDADRVRTSLEQIPVVEVPNG